MTFLTDRNYGSFKTKKKKIRYRRYTGFSSEWEPIKGYEFEILIDKENSEWEKAWDDKDKKRGLKICKKKLKDPSYSPYDDDDLDFSELYASIDEDTLSVISTKEYLEGLEVMKKEYEELLFAFNLVVKQNEELRTEIERLKETIRIIGKK